MRGWGYRNEGRRGRKRWSKRKKRKRGCEGEKEGWGVLVMEIDDEEARGRVSERKKEKIEKRRKSWREKSIQKRKYETW